MRCRRAAAPCESSQLPRGAHSATRCNVVAPKAKGRIGATGRGLSFGAAVPHLGQLVTASAIREDSRAGKSANVTPRSCGQRSLDRVSDAEGALDQSLFDLAQIIPDHEFRFVDQFLAALVPMTATVIVHAQGMGLVRRIFRRFAVRAGGSRPEGPSVFLVTAIVATMLATHFLEVVAWAGFYILTGLIPNSDLAMQFSMANYSTLGSGMSLPDRWRGLAGFEAMTSMLMFGWSTAVLAAVVQKANSAAD